MTIEKDKNGSGHIYLTKEEYDQFLHGVPIITQRNTDAGMVEVEVRKRQSCPTRHTVSYLRNLIRAHQIKQGQGDDCCTLTVNDVLEGKKLAPQHRLRPTDQAPIRDDLERFSLIIGGNVSIVKLAELV